MKYNKALTIRLDDLKYKELEQLAESKESSVGSLVRQAISKYLLDNK
jgi:predicted transcriptional regulator